MYGFNQNSVLYILHKLLENQDKYCGTLSIKTTVYNKPSSQIFQLERNISLARRWSAVNVSNERSREGVVESRCSLLELLGRK